MRDWSEVTRWPTASHSQPDVRADERALLLRAAGSVPGARKALASQPGDELRELAV